NDITTTAGSRQSPIYVQDDDDDKTYYVGDVVDSSAPHSAQQPLKTPSAPGAGRTVYPGFGSFDPSVHHPNGAVSGAGSFGSFQTSSVSTPAPQNHSAWPDLSFLARKQP